VAPALQLRQLRKVRRNPRAWSIGQLVSVWLEIKVTRARESPFRGSNNILMIKFIFEKRSWVMRYVRGLEMKMKRRQMKAIIKRFVRDESGATAIEYGLIAAGISVAIIAAVQATGVNLNGTFTAVSNAIK